MKIRKIVVYPGAEALKLVLARLKKRLGMDIDTLDGYTHRVEYNDDSDHHTIRRAYMVYRNFHHFTRRDGRNSVDWIVALGTPSGNPYLYDGMNADIIMVKGMGVLQLGFSDHTYIASQNGAILQKPRDNFDLKPWASKKYGRIDQRELKEMRDNRPNPFQRFLPKDLKYDRKFINSLALQLERFLLEN